MEVSVTDAQTRLAELVRLAEEGDDVVLTHHGRAVARLMAVEQVVTPSRRRTLMEELRRTGAAKAKPGPNAARSQDDLYGEDGLPG